MTPTEEGPGQGPVAGFPADHLREALRMMWGSDLSVALWEEVREEPAGSGDRKPQRPRRYLAGV